MHRRRPLLESTQSLLPFTFLSQTTIIYMNIDILYLFFRNHCRVILIKTLTLRITQLLLPSMPENFILSNHAFVSLQIIFLTHMVHTLQWLPMVIN